MVRFGVGALGAVSMGVGAWLVAGTGSVRDVAVWLGGAVVLHDAVLAPLVLGLGLLLGRTGGLGGGEAGGQGGGLAGGLGGGRGLVRGALVVGGSLTLVALPVLLRPGARANSSVLPLDYVSNWLLALAAVAVLAVLLGVTRAAVRAVRQRRRS
ncbi:hypothetical protein RKE29_01730 [Streptomyces sp. B1866]|uniref:hypothetical protein n=1 Tax=Streptomyces sp. B1866 TaxID=3075431 RepID=UPI002891C245|nr:hypothetical protein [Streptomyces sp. B1866]MDT3395380.1 hypothetical protein [Streptomyces sp. B1866]